MKLMSTRIALGFGLPVLLATQAQAAIVSGYGVEASTSTASNCPSYCTTANGGDFQYDSAGGEYSTTASAAQNSYGSASASAIYTGSTATYLPILKVDTTAGSGKGAFASAWGVQGYTYSGVAKTVTLDFNLHGMVSGSNSSLRADVAVFATSELEWYSDFGTLVYEVAPPGSVVGNESVFMSNTNGLEDNVSDSITFNVTDGMDFYVVAGLGATAKGGFADASNTFTMLFDDDVGMTHVASSSAVPVPAAAWLFGSALLGLFGAKRSKFASA